MFLIENDSVICKDKKMQEKINTVTVSVQSEFAEFLTKSEFD